VRAPPLVLGLLMPGAEVGSQGHWRVEAWGVDGGGENSVVDVWEVVAESSTSVEWLIQGTGIDGLFYGDLVPFLSKVGNVIRAEVASWHDGLLARRIHQSQATSSDCGVP
jgi:hypothetical protein